VAAAVHTAVAFFFGSGISGVSVGFFSATWESEFAGDLARSDSGGGPAAIGPPGKQFEWQ